MKGFIKNFMGAVAVLGAIFVTALVWHTNIIGYSEIYNKEFGGSYNAKAKVFDTGAQKRVEPNGTAWYKVVPGERG